MRGVVQNCCFNLQTSSGVPLSNSIRISIEYLPRVVSYSKMIVGDMKTTDVFIM